MMRGAALALVLAAASPVFAASRVWAETAYVSDQLVLNVYTEQNQQGQRLATLHSGARVETLASSADFTQVRLADGTTGWMSANMLSDRRTVVVVGQGRAQVRAAPGSFRLVGLADPGAIASLKWFTPTAA